MNLGIIEKFDLFEIGISLKKTYEKKFTNEKLRFITLDEPDEIDVLILPSFANENLLSLYLKKMRKNAIIIVNVDDRELIKQLYKTQFPLVSYGFSNKSSITLSSLVSRDKDTLMCCIQRDIKTINGNKVFEQEFSINYINISSMDTLLIISVLLVLDISIHDINNTFLEFFNFC